MSFAQAQKQARAEARANAGSSTQVEEQVSESVALYALPVDIRKDVVADNANLTKELDESIAKLKAEISKVTRQKAIALEAGALAELDNLLGYGEFPDFTSTRGAVLSFYAAANLRQQLFDTSCTLGSYLSVEPGAAHPEYTSWTATSKSAKYDSFNRTLSHEDKLELDALDDYFDGFQGVGISGMQTAGRRLAQLKREKNISI